MKRKFFNDISANSFQLIINQVCGLAIFYILSACLGKDDFGQINWTLALLLTAFNILSFGIDQVAVKKIAAGGDAGHILSLYTTHILLAGLLFYLSLIAIQFIFKGFIRLPHLLLLLGIGKLMIFFSTPFKQLATGLEKFRPLLYMSVCSNIIRSIALITLALASQLNLTAVIIIFIAGDTAELLLSLFIVKKVFKIPVTLSADKKTYLALIKESLPQAGVAIFTSTLARFDWILLGLLASNAILAEYSFAYKVFEVATLPLLIIAPVLIPRFTKIFHPGSTVQSRNKIDDLFILLRIEMIIASFAGLMLTVCWTPVVDLLTNGQYGSVNYHTILLLAGSMPLIYFNNFAWTVNFAKGRLKMILYIIAVTCFINITSDIVLIPFFKGEGAAAGYLLAIFVQSILYLRKTELNGIEKKWRQLTIAPFCAIISGCLANFIFHNNVLIIFSSLLFFLLLVVISKQARLSDWLLLKQQLAYKSNQLTAFPD